MGQLKLEGLQGLWSVGAVEREGGIDYCKNVTSVKT